MATNNTQVGSTITMRTSSNGSSAELSELCGFTFCGSDFPCFLTLVVVVTLACALGGFLSTLYVISKHYRNTRNTCNSPRRNRPHPALIRIIGRLPKKVGWEVFRSDPLLKKETFPARAACLLIAPSDPDFERSPVYRPVTEPVTAPHQNV